jgi:hypothetical protein
MASNCLTCYEKIQHLACDNTEGMEAEVNANEEEVGSDSNETEKDYSEHEEFLVIIIQNMRSNLVTNN